MRMFTLALSTVLAAAPALMASKSENWIEVRSPHFIVLTNGSEKQGRRVGDQFERMRSVFRAAFPGLQVDPASPIVVLAVRDEKSFRSLEPAEYLGKGKLEIAGLFLRAPEKNYVLLRLDAGGDHPYSIVYHEYTHLLSSKAEEWLPLWLNEGLAEFYQNTEIREKDALLGQPSVGNILSLRQSRLLPLATLFTIDHTSPYYHEENKGTIFYAESWALTHYFMVKDRQENTHRMVNYSALVSQHVDSVTAATRAFGDLKQLQSALEQYVQQGSFSYFKMPTTTDVDDSAFQVQSLTEAQADAARADFLAYNQRTMDARSLLDDVLREDPNNVAAHETMGYLEFHQGHLDEARKWYEQAVKLDSQSYLAQYFYAAMTMNGGSLRPEDSAQVETSLRAAIKLNPSFAPAYDRLAVFYAMRRQNLDEAHRLALTAVELEPGNVGYRMNTASVLLAMEQGSNAVKVLQNATKLAKNPEELAQVQNMLQAAEQYQAARERVDEENRRVAQQAATGETERTAASGESADVADQETTGPPVLQHRDLPPGPRHAVEGTIQSVDCAPPTAMDLKIEAGQQTVALHSDNFYIVRFMASNFVPKGELHPCSDLKGMHARVEFVEGHDNSALGQIVSVTLSK
jgi:tetratricopeptide (TPR) repeat protein